jgi:hypothetical protein
MNQFAILFEGRVPIAGLNSNSLTQVAKKLFATLPLLGCVARIILKQAKSFVGFRYAAI